MTMCYVIAVTANMAITVEGIQLINCTISFLDSEKQLYSSYSFENKSCFPFCSRPMWFFFTVSDNVENKKNPHTFKTKWHS